MQKKYFFILLVLMSSCRDSSPKVKVSGNEIYHDQSESHFSIAQSADKQLMVSKTNTTYELLSFFNEKGENHLVAKMTKNENYAMDSTASLADFDIQIEPIQKKTEQLQSVRVKLKATEIDLSDKVIIAQKETNNNQLEDSYEMYSLLNGNLLMNFTYTHFKAIIPNTSHKRFFGYLSKSSCYQPNEESLGVLTFANSEKVIERLHIQPTGNESFPSYTPEMTMVVNAESANKLSTDGKTVIMTNLDARFSSEQINDFAWQINYTSDSGKTYSVLIPIHLDLFDLAAAQYDKNVFRITKE